MLAKQHLPTELKVLARTGWTTDELAQALSDEARERRIVPPYALVSLSVGVNNQYRGRPVATFASDFAALLDRAVALAGSTAARVLVLSIPDWGHSPFALSRGANRRQIADQIDAYNACKRELTQTRGAQWLDITPSSREIGADFAPDGLHPGPRAYAHWAQAALAPATRALSEEPPCPPLS